MKAYLCNLALKIMLTMANVLTSQPCTALGGTVHSHWVLTKIRYSSGSEIIDLVLWCPLDLLLTACIAAQGSSDIS